MAYHYLWNTIIKRPSLRSEFKICQSRIYLLFFKIRASYTLGLMQATSSPPTQISAFVHLRFVETPGTWLPPACLFPSTIWYFWPFAAVLLDTLFPLSAMCAWSFWCMCKTTCVWLQHYSKWLVSLVRFIFRNFIVLSFMESVLLIGILYFMISMLNREAKKVSCKEWMAGWNTIIKPQQLVIVR